MPAEKRKRSTASISSTAGHPPRRVVSVANLLRMRSRVDAPSESKHTDQIKDRSKKRRKVSLSSKSSLNRSSTRKAPRRSVTVKAEPSDSVKSEPNGRAKSEPNGRVKTEAGDRVKTETGEPTVNVYPIFQSSRSSRSQKSPRNPARKSNANLLAPGQPTSQGKAIPPLEASPNSQTSKANSKAGSTTSNSRTADKSSNSQSATASSSARSAGSQSAPEEEKSLTTRLEEFIQRIERDIARDEQKSSNSSNTESPNHTCMATQNSDLLDAAVRRSEPDRSRMSVSQNSFKAANPRRNAKRSRSDRRFVCDHTGCEKSYKSAGALKQHQESAHEGKRYPCTYDGCAYVANREGNLDRHIRTRHTGECELHRCTYDGCAYTTKFAHVLKAHLRGHTGDLLRCTYDGCAYAAKHRSNLNKHIRTQHTGECELHRCTYDGCAYAAKDRSQLNQHIKSVHEGVRYSCEAQGCSYSATRKTCLRRHQRTVHAGEIIELQPSRPGTVSRGQRSSKRQATQSNQLASSRSSGGTRSNREEVNLGAPSGLPLEVFQRAMRALSRVRYNEHGELDFDSDVEDELDEPDEEDEDAAIREMLIGFGIHPPGDASGGNGDVNGGNDTDLPPMDFGDDLPSLGGDGSDNLLPPLGGGGSDNLLPPLGGDVGELDLPPLDQLLPVAPIPGTEPAASVKSEPSVKPEPSVKTESNVKTEQGVKSEHGVKSEQGVKAESKFGVKSEVQANIDPVKEERRRERRRRQEKTDRLQEALFAAPDNVHAAAMAYYAAKKAARGVVALVKCGEAVQDDSKLMPLAQRIVETGRVFFELRAQEQGIPREEGESGFDAAMAYIVQHEEGIREEYHRLKAEREKAQALALLSSSSGIVPTSRPSQPPPLEADCEGSGGSL